VSTIALETLTVARLRGCSFAEIAARPMNLLGPDLVVSLRTLDLLHCKQ
jgi:hypothetical protein